MQQLTGTGLAVSTVAAAEQRTEDTPRHPAPTPRHTQPPASVQTGEPPTQISILSTIDLTRFQARTVHTGCLPAIGKSEIEK